MGSAKEPETLQLLKQEAGPEDGHQPNTSSLCSQEKVNCLQNISCDGGDFTMRNCCVNELGTKESSPEDTMVDNPNREGKASTVDLKPSMDLAAAPDAVELKDSGVGESPLEAGGEIAAGCNLQNNSEQSSSLKECPSSPANTCNRLEGKVASSLDEKESAGETFKPLPVEPCLKGANKDSSSAPASLKHVVFLEPTKNKPEAENLSAGIGPPKAGPTVHVCLQKPSQGQPGASEEGLSHFSSDIREAVECSNEGHGKTVASEAAKESVLEPLGAGTASKKSVESKAEVNHLTHSGEMRFPVPKTNMDGGSSAMPKIPTVVVAAAVPHEVKHHGPLGESSATADQALEETERLSEATSSSIEGKNQAQEQQKPEATSVGVGVGEEHTTKTEMRSVELLAKTCSFEVTPPQQDAGTQAGHRVSVVSIAVSPINPPDGSTTFTFHTHGSSLKSPGPELKPSKKDVEMQVSIPVETRSVATGPMTPVTKSPQASYPEVHVKGAQEETPEPVREVSWDEKGMTWEVYGASMEVEVLGMAIQKHLEKQIEEHGRQMVMTPQSTRTSSIKGPPRKGEIKRQPSVFRALLQNMRRPRCCSRGGPAVE